MFGFDTSMFGLLQVTPSFLGTFGTRNADGVYEISALQTSLLNSIPWIGKLAGIMMAEPVNDRFGYRKSMILTCVIQSVGVVVESERIRP